MQTGANVRDQATQILRELYGPSATFREGQLEAIESTLARRRTLVVQRTGWGKSLVYFIATKLLRRSGAGLTIVVSPLIALMDNQRDAATRMGLECETLNYTTKGRSDEICDRMRRNQLDVVFTTPETLFKSEVQRALPNVRVGLFVIDEAHCISDWGHDFRLDYAKLRYVISMLPNTPVLATTATATQRVIDDLCVQLGGDVFVSRGPLNRESLSLHVFHIPDAAQKYAWILDHIESIPGTGIIYCSTRRDCELLAEFLNERDVPAVPYCSERNGDEKDYAANLERFRKNEVKAIVATTKLGMGYDKDDVGFVIHYQLPANIISYYQQVGRAGRKLNRAYAVLLYGGEADEKIQEYFITSAFPEEHEMRDVLQAVASQDGITKGRLYAMLNMREGRIRKALEFLAYEGNVEKKVTGRTTLYYATAKPFAYDRARFESVTTQRRVELDQMIAYARGVGVRCRSEYVLDALESPTGHACGHCDVCLKRDSGRPACTDASLDAARSFMALRTLRIKPRAQWVANAYLDRGSAIESRCEWGWSLSRYGWGYFGNLVRVGKYPAPGEQARFSDELVERSCEVLGPMVREKGIAGVTFVPSLRSDVVHDFACRLAARLGLPLYYALGKRQAAMQKEQENSACQSANAMASFYLRDDCPQLPESVILVDDIVDSKWTLTVCAALLMGSMPEQLGHVAQGTCSHVYPFALADSHNE